MHSDTKYAVVLSAIVLLVVAVTADATLSKGAFNPFAPQKKIKVVSPIPAVPKNIPVLNVDPPNCATLNAAAAKNKLTGDAVNNRFQSNWFICDAGNFSALNSFPTYCKGIALTLANMPNHPDLNRLLSLQATCLRGGIDPAPANPGVQIDGGALIAKNCAQLIAQNNNGPVLDVKEADNLNMCFSGSATDFYMGAEYCDIARWALAADPAQYVQLTDDVDTCNNGGINP